MLVNEARKDLLNGSNLCIMRVEFLDILDPTSAVLSINSSCGVDGFDINDGKELGKLNEQPSFCQEHCGLDWHR